MASLYDRHDLYDLIAPPNPAMEAFYVDQAKARGSRVLDLACGSGRVTIPLAKAGLEVVGIDLSAPMLTRTQHLASASGVDVTTHLRDMRDFSLEGDSSTPCSSRETRSCTS